ncbi:MAG: glycerol-3-phosphate 1-O-acyltransferase PlsY [Verrucomicrobiota bacterium]|nr:glycerol-3-phosphate 1-O-acyltransferase PlsY [Verrucomicrobiota bacterium]
MFFVFVVLSAYLLGSIPAGLIVGKTRGIDIRQHGSGNIGATNITRVLGKKWGYLVFAADALKGLSAVLIGECLAQRFHQWVALAGVLAAISVVIGHSAPVWLKFRGGKGVATAAGACLGLVPVATLVAFVAWCIIFFASRYVSLASIIAAAVLPMSARFLPFGHRADPLVFGFLLLIATLVIFRHWTNIGRLFKGTETRFERK